MKRVGLQNSKRVFSAALLFVGLLIATPIEPAMAVNDVQASCVIGSSSLCPAQSPQEIYNLYGTTTNGAYWLNVNGTATQTYLILDTNYPDSGMWFLGMKGTKTSTNFNYSSTNWTSQSTTLNTGSLSDNVSTDAKFDAFNYLPVTKVVGVFKDRDSYAFNSSGSGMLGTNSFGGHTWKEDIASQTMFSRFTNTGILYNATGTMTRYDLYRESNASNGKLVFAYQFGYAKYGFNYSNGAAVYRWGIAFNNENDDPRIDSSDAQAGIGLTSYGAASVFSYSDNLSYSINGGTGQLNGATATYPSGFQIWGKMAAPSLATPGALSLTNQGSGSVQLSFAAASGATEYAIQYKSAGTNWNTGTTVRLTNPSATPSATITGLSTGSYDFRVFSRATNNSSSGNSYLLAQTIDATAPTISSINITSSAGSDSIYGLGETVTATINWSESVTVTGSPRIPIQGLTSKFLTYVAGSGTTTTTFSFVVSNTDLDRDGFSISSSSLSLNSGTIKDSAGNDANLTHSAIVSSTTMQIDGVPPTLIGAVVSSSGQRVTLNFSETISSTISAYSSITLMVGSTRDSLSNGSTADSRLSMSLAFSALSGATVTLSYTDPSAGNDVNALQDEAGNDLATFSNYSVTNSSTINTNTTASIALNPASTTAVFRSTTSLKVSTNTEGKVTFFHNGKVITGCRSVTTTSSTPFYATCSWKPSVQHFVTLKAQFAPSGAGFTNSSTENLSIYVTRRGGLR